MIWEVFVLLGSQGEDAISYEIGTLHGDDEPILILNHDLSKIKLSGSIPEIDELIGWLQALKTANEKYGHEQTIKEKRKLARKKAKEASK